MAVASFSETVGSTAVVTIDGRDYAVGPIDLDCLTACAAEIRQQAGDPFEGLMPRLQALPEVIAEKLFREAMEIHAQTARATPMQALAWALDVPDGFAFMLWYLLQRGAGGNSASPGNLPPPAREVVMRYLVELRFSDPNGYADLIEKIGNISGYKALSKAAAAVHRAAANLMRTAITGHSYGEG